MISVYCMRLRMVLVYFEFVYLIIEIYPRDQEFHTKYNKIEYKKCGELVLILISKS